MSSVRKISAMTAAASVAGVDFLPIVQGGVNKKVTFTALFTNVPGNLTVAGVIQSGSSITLPGSPNGFIQSNSGTCPKLFFANAAYTIEQFNGVNPQIFNLYNTWAAAGVDYERGHFRWAANVLEIGTEKGGGGTARTLALMVNGANNMTFDTGATHFWKALDLNASMTFGTDNTFNIGSPTNRPANIYVGNSVFIAGTLQLSSGIFEWANKARIYGGATDGILTFYNNAQTDFTRVNLGGVTDSFGAIARDGAGVAIVGGAGGSTAWLRIPAVTVAALPAAATAGVGARCFVTDATVTTNGTIVAGGGTNKVPVYSNAINWIIG